MTKQTLQNPSNATFNKRVFSSVALMFTGLSLPISGIMCHLLQNEPLMGARHYWMSMHNGAAILFFSMALLHVSFNWSSMKRYLFESLKQKRKTNTNREVYWALLLCLLFMGLLPLHGS